MPKRAVVVAYGGRTAIVGDPKDHATRDLIKRVRGQAGQEGRDGKERQDGQGSRR